MAITINDNSRTIAYGFKSGESTIYYADKAAREALLAGVKFVTLDSLPEANEASYKEYSGQFVLVPTSASTAATGDVKAEYVIIRSGSAGSYTYAWEKLGDRSLDLSQYAKINHKHKVTAAGTNSSSAVSFDKTEDVALGEGTTFTNADSDLKDMSAIIAGSNTTSSVTFDGTKDGNKIAAVTAMPASTVPGYALGAETKKYVSASASGAAVSTVSKLVVESSANVGSVTAGSDAALTGGSVASFTQGAKASFTQGSKASFSVSAPDSEGIVTYTFTANGDDTFTANGDDSFTANTLQGLSGGKATVVTLPKFAEQTIATGISAQPTISLALADATSDGAVQLVSAQGSLSTSGTNDVTFGALTGKTADVVAIGATGTAAAQTWSQGTTSISGKATAQVITVGTNDQVTALTGITNAVAAAQTFTGSEVESGTEYVSTN